MRILYIFIHTDAFTTYIYIDEERVRVWVEEVFSAHYDIIKLYEPNQKILLEKLMKRIKALARK